MNKIIDGKRYDTATAEEIESAGTEGSVTDLDYYCETLYRKRTGEYFVHFAGGPQTALAESRGTNWVGGERIEPVGWEAARAWGERHMDADRYEEVFGAAGEAASSLYIKSLGAEARAKLDREAARSGRTRGQIVEELLLGL